MSQYPTPNQTYFSGLKYNPSFFTSSSGVSLQYATNNFLQRIGTNPTSTATQTTFSGSINVNSLTTTTDSTIGGNLTIANTKNLYISGNVGIGSTTPAYPLDVSGHIHTNKNLYIDGQCGIGTTTPAYPLDVSGHIHTNKNVYIDGQCGIGTSTPAYPLDVSGSTRIQGTNKLILNNSNNNVYGDVTNLYYNVNGGNHNYNVSNNTVASITGMGVGINTTVVAPVLYTAPGTINPSSFVLDVNVGSIRVRGTEGIVFSEQDAWIYAIGGTGMYYNSWVYGQDALHTFLSINGTYGEIANVPLIVSKYGISVNANTPNTTPNLATAINALNVSGGIYTNSTLTSKSIGVGTTTPAYTLDVSGSIYTNKNIGIATPPSTYVLDVSGDFRSNGLLSIVKQLVIGTGSTNHSLNVYGNAYVSSSAYIMNKCGIGRTNPNYTLDVSGNQHTNGLVFCDSGISIAKSTNTYPLDVSGSAYVSTNAYIMNQVGIGKTNPSYALDVSGSIGGSNGLFLNSLTSLNSNQIQFTNGTANIYTIQQIDNASQNYFRLGRNGYNDIVINLAGTGIVSIGQSIQSPKYDLNYSVIPTLTNTSIGYAITPTTTPTLPITLTSSTAYALTFTSLPIGVFLIQGYAIGTFITTAITNIKLGLNTTATAPTANSFTQQILPVLSSTSVQSLSYNFYLSNTSVATYYIVFATGASFGASSVTGFTASFIRIA